MAEFTEIYQLHSTNKTHMGKIGGNGPWDILTIYAGTFVLAIVTIPTVLILLKDFGVISKLCRTTKCYWIWDTISLHCRNGINYNTFSTNVPEPSSQGARGDGMKGCNCLQRRQIYRLCSLNYLLELGLIMCTVIATLLHSATKNKLFSSLYISFDSRNNEDLCLTNITSNNTG